MDRTPATLATPARPLGTPWLPAALAAAALTAAAVVLAVTGATAAAAPAALVLVAAGGVSTAPVRLAAGLLAGWLAWCVALPLAGPVAGWGTATALLLLASLLATGLALLGRERARAAVRLRDELAATVVQDPLTGVANGRGLALLGSPVVEGARRRGDAVHCLVLDVDGLEAVNADLGEAAGDEVLVAVAEALTGAVRGADVVARWGGDEFVVVGPGTGIPALEVERRVRERLVAHPPVPLRAWTPWVSAGRAVLTPWDAGGLDALMLAADRDLHARRSVRRDRPGASVAGRTPPVDPAPQGSG